MKDRFFRWEANILALDVKNLEESYDLYPKMLAQRHCLNDDWYREDLLQLCYIFEKNRGKDRL